MGFISVNGVELYYERHGAGQPILFCHGDCRDYRAWAPQIEALADDYEVIVYDAYGYGRSSGADRDTVFFNTHVADVYALIEALDLDNPILVGWSMGGRVAYTVAAQYPELFAGLIVLEPASRNASEPPLPAKLVSKATLQIASVIGWPRFYALRRWTRDLRGASDPHAETVVEGLDMTKSEYVADAERQIDTAEYNKFISGLLQEMEGDDDPVIEFSSIEVPTLALTGADSHERWEQRIDTLASEAPNTRRETIPNAGHAAHIDNAAAFNRILRDFLSDISHPETEAEHK